MMWPEKNAYANRSPLLSFPHTGNKQSTMSVYGQTTDLNQFQRVEHGFVSVAFLITNQTSRDKVTRQSYSKPNYAETQSG